MGDTIQFDTSETVVGGVNITKAVQEDKKLLFNESYTVVGDRLSAPSLYACYDLTVLGDLEVKEIEVRGNLYVMGNLKAMRVSCLKAIFCSGNIEADIVFCSEIVANDISCQTLTCLGNIIARTTIDIGSSLRSEKTVVAGEGILGGGEFSAQNAVAAEYFDFQGEVFGKVTELETDETFGAPHPDTMEEENFDSLFSKLKHTISDELQRAGEIDEDQLVAFISRLSAVDEDHLSDWGLLTERLIELSYADQITNLRDYLYVIMATKVLPEAIVGYETLEHVFDNLLVEAETRLYSIPYKAKNIEEFAYSLKIINMCENELRISREDILDRVFQSVGIKYKTVKSFFG